MIDKIWLIRKPSEQILFIVDGRSITMQAVNGPRRGSKTMYYDTDATTLAALQEAVAHAIMTCGFSIMNQWQENKDEE